MATLETQQLDEVIVNSRRKMLALGGAALAGLAFAGVKVAEAQAAPAYTDADILNSIPFEEIAITSGIKIIAGDPPPRAFALPDVKGAAAIADLSAGGKCQRCWRVLTEVGTHDDHPDLCNRCDAAVAESGPVEKSPA